MASIRLRSTSACSLRHGTRGRMERVEATRRAFLAGAASVLAACRVAPPSPPPPPAPAAPPPLRIPEITGLLPVADLRWIVQTRPREIAEVPWLIPAVARVAPEENLTRFTQ